MYTKRLFLALLGLNFVASHEFYMPSEEAEILEAVNYKDTVEPVEPILAIETHERRMLESDGDDMGDALLLFVIGLLLIPFSITYLWKNEKKLVTYKKCMG